MQGLNLHLLPLESPACWQMSTVNSENELELLQPSSRGYHGLWIPSSFSCTAAVCSFNCFPLQFMNFTSWKRAGGAWLGKDPSALPTRILAQEGLQHCPSKKHKLEVPWRNLLLYTQKQSTPRTTPGHQPCLSSPTATSQWVLTTLALPLTISHHLWVYNCRNHLNVASEDVSACKSKLVEAFPSSGSKD